MGRFSLDVIEDMLDNERFGGRGDVQEAIACLYSLQLTISPMKYETLKRRLEELRERLS